MWQMTKVGSNVTLSENQGKERPMKICIIQAKWWRTPHKIAVIRYYTLELYWFSNECREVGKDY